MNNRRRKRITYKPSGASRAGAVINMVVGLAFFVLGITVIIPASAGFGIIWCVICAGMVITSAYLAFGGTKHISPEVYVEDEEVPSPAQDTSGTETENCPSAGDIEARLERLSALREKGLITEQEYEKKRQDILDEL